MRISEGLAVSLSGTGAIDILLGGLLNGLNDNSRIQCGKMAA
jgi:hypothetical protein